MMSPGSIVGLLAMLGAIVWCLASLARVVVGPERKKAFANSGKAVMAFIAGGIVVGVLGPQTSPRPTAPTPPAEASMSAQPATTEPLPLATTMKVPTPAVITLAPHVIARYQTSNTLVSLVIDDFSLDERSALIEIATKECAGAAFCSVGFWTVDAVAPRKLKMSDEAIAARLAHYVHSDKTGLDTLNWNCSVVAGTEDCL